MKTNSNYFHQACGLVRRLSFLALILGGAVVMPARGDDNSEFFDSLTNPSDTNGWLQTIDYSDVQGSFSVTNGGYRLQADSKSASPQDFAAIASYPPNLVYTNFQLSVDVINWNRYPWPSNMSEIALLAREQGSALFNARFYAFALQPNSHTNNDGLGNVQIYRLDSGLNQASQTMITLDFPINLADQYRLVFTGVGSLLSGQLFDLTNLVQPVAAIQTTDATYPSGAVGIGATDIADISGLGNKPVDFTVNNFRAGPPAPALAIQQTITLSWPDSYVGYILQSAASVNGPWLSVSVTPQDSAGLYTASLGNTNSSLFFRLTQTASAGNQ